MIRPDLVEYIKGQIAKGRGSEEIRSLLLGAGWQAQDIEDALKAALGPNIPAPSYGEGSMYGNSTGYTNTSYLPGAGALLEEAWGIYKNRIGTFLGIIGMQIIITLFFVGVLFVIGILLGTLYAGLNIFGAHAAITETFIPPSQPMPSPDPAAAAINIINWLLGFGIIIAVIGLIFIPSIWSQAAMIYAVKDNAEGIGTMEAYRRGWHKIGSFIWLGILSSIIIFGGFLFFFIPGVIFSVWFSLAIYIVVAENIGGMNAMIKSREYIRGRGWEVFGLILVIFLIQVGIRIAFMILSAILEALNLSFLNLLVGLASFVFSIAIVPFTVIYSYLIYKYLRQIKGDFAFTPSSEAKMKYLAVAVLGILLVVLGIYFAVSAASKSVTTSRSKAEAAAYKSTVYSLASAVVICCDDPDNKLQTTPGGDACKPNLGTKLPTAQQIKAANVTYAVAQNGRCADMDPGLIVIPTGLKYDACNGPATIRTSKVTLPPGC